MANNSSYGVFLKETDLSQRISLASSTIGVIVGEASKGPVGERVLITDTEQLNQVFGPRNTKHKFGLYAAFQFLQEASQLWYTRVANGALYAGAYLTVDDPSAAVPHLQLTVFDNGSNQPLGIAAPQDVTWLITTPGVENILCMFYCANPGEWNNKISVKISPSNPRGLPVGHPAHNVLDFYVDVYQNYTGPSDLPVERFFVAREEKIDGDGNQMYIEDVINNNSKYIRVKNNVLCGPVEIRETAFEFFEGASDGIPATVDQLLEAWDLYEDREEVDCNLFINAGYADPLIQAKMDQIARARHDTFCILDVPSTEQELVDAINYRRNTLNLNSSYSGLYSPDLYVLDDTNNKKLWVPPSGHVAAVYARTDRERALWFAPAGIQRGGLSILDMKQRYKQGARDALDRAQVNPIRFIPGFGYVVWGQLTLQSFESAFSDVNIRRLFNFVKARISTSVKSGVFEPNDELLRAFLVRTCSDFLKPIQQERAFYEFDVVCDERNNSFSDIANGDLHLDVYGDPVIAAKRIHLTANILATGSTAFSEA